MTDSPHVSRNLTRTMPLNKVNIVTASFAVTLILQTALTYLVLDPKVGFDDANITQVYARHFAEGHGFVYNIGGERVEGSTSLIWTLLNAAMFLTPYPILMITALSFLLTAGTLALSGRIGRDLGGSDTTVATVYLLFNLFPGLFAWSLWSLMDITLWLFAITAMVWAVLQVGRDEMPSVSASLTLLICAAVLPIVRPEGIALVLAVAAFLFMFRSAVDNSARIAIWIASLGLASIAAATLWRLAYFGYPVPNTFYAKTSTDLVNQIAVGARYLGGFLAEPATVILLVGLGLGVATLRTSDRLAQRFYGMLVPYLAIGGFVVYVILGGDHFGSDRFFLFLTPLCLPVLAVLMLQIWERSSDRFGNLVLGGTLLLYTTLVWAIFYMQGGGVRHELRIAENLRQVGTTLADLPGAPTLATIAAGGIKMTYPGTVYDVLGLNWIAMAHSGSVRTDLPKNHGGFNAEVFLHARPDLVFPRQGNCDDGRDTVEGQFGLNVTLNISESEFFRQRYIPMCSDDVVLYVAKDLVEVLEAQGFQPYPVDWPGR